MAFNPFDSLRIGQGFDVHPFDAAKPLRLGGVSIPEAIGLRGHSDADVVLHAVTDAVLGALGWGDIGRWFPDTDASFAGADSRQFLNEVMEKVVDAGWGIVNCDIVILAEKPRIAPHVELMKAEIGRCLRVTPERVGIKATTTERLGFVGREEGIAASAVALVYRSEPLKS